MFVHIFALYVGGGGHQCISEQGSKHRKKKLQILWNLSKMVGLPLVLESLEESLETLEETRDSLENGQFLGCPNRKIAIAAIFQIAVKSRDSKLQSTLQNRSRIASKAVESNVEIPTEIATIFKSLRFEIASGLDLKSPATATISFSKNPLPDANEIFPVV